jgi:N-acetylmuramoyl-L-alanine amidase
MDQVDNVKLKKWEPLMALVLLVLVYVVSSQAGKMTAEVSTKPGKEKPVVVIDAGHGGNDPGKIGIDGTLEKDINLQIAYRLKKYLEASDVKVVLTREDDNGLYTEKDSRKKMADMSKRCEIINDESPSLTVSIHQNSYHEEYVYGGQVFYYKKSDKGKELAEILQSRFDYVLGEKNTRLAKPNDNYYLLLHVRTPIVIVECGFLTNWKESALLNNLDYQDRVAWTIHMGVMEYLNTR